MGRTASTAVVCVCVISMAFSEWQSNLFEVLLALHPIFSQPFLFSASVVGDTDECMITPWCETSIAKPRTTPERPAFNVAQLADIWNVSTEWLTYTQIQTANTWWLQMDRLHILIDSCQIINMILAVNVLWVLVPRLTVIEWSGWESEWERAEAHCPHHRLQAMSLATQHTQRKYFLLWQPSVCSHTCGGWDSVW